MDWLSPRDPVSAWTHGLWMLLAIPAGALLVWRNRDNAGKCFGTAVFAFTLVGCFGASGFYHAAADGPLRERLHALDHIGIYLLIAGTVTPIALAILRGWWRRWLLAQIWLLALTGIILRLTVDMPAWVSTGFYLAMGWVGVVTYFELARRVSHAGLRPIWVGGLCYTIGAAMNLAHWPNPWPSVVGSHELFHLWVMAGSASCFWFMLVVLTPYRPAAVVRTAARTFPVVGVRLDQARTCPEQ